MHSMYSDFACLTKVQNNYVITIRTKYKPMQKVFEICSKNASDRPDLQLVRRPAGQG